MKFRSFCLAGTFLFYTLGALAQSGYQVGISRVSTEPDTTLFSVAMSGYGYPPEGRFSIEWIKAGEAPASISAVTGYENTLYAADSLGVLWKGDPSGSSVRWSKFSKAPHMMALASWKGYLYGLNGDGSLRRRRIARKGKWEKIGKAPAVKGMAALKGNLYAVDEKGSLLRLDPAQRHPSWTLVGKAAGTVTGLTSRGDRLFATGAADTLWRIQPLKPGAPWTEMGRYNGITYDIHVANMVVVNNRLYAITRDHQLFVSRHATDGNLSATALAITHDGKTIVMMGVDLTGFDYSLTDAVKDIISPERHIPKEAILINASHTHFPPTAQAYPAWAPFLHHPDTLYMKLLKSAMVKAINHALDSMSPVSLYVGRGETRIGINRSAADPDVPIDRTLDVLEAKTPDGKVKAILFLAACHAVFNNSGREGYTLSANFPGVTRKLIRERTGANSVFIQGCAGDINPRSANHVETGTELAHDIFKVIDGKMTPLSGDISFSFDSIHIPIQPWLPEKIRQFKKGNNGKSGDVEAVKNVRWADLMLRRYAAGTVQHYLPEYFQYFSIGNWELVGLSREVVDEYGPAIRKIWPHKMVSVAGYCNDVASYLPKEWHVVTQTYEGYGSFFWYGQSGLPPVNIFDIVIEGVKRFK